jgi:hypothetical protein
MKKLQCFVISLLSLGTLLFSYERVSAASWLPKQIQDLFDLMGPGGSGTTGFATSRVQMLLLLGLGALVLAAVVYAAMAALKYIQSQGDPGKIEEAGKAVKAIFTGLAVLMVAIVGIVLVFVFFGTGLFDSSAYQVCASAADSPGCIACKGDLKSGLSINYTYGGSGWGGGGTVTTTGGEGGLVDDWDTVKYNPYASRPGVVGGSNREICTYCEWEYYAVNRELGDPNPASPWTPDAISDPLCTEK